MTLCRQYQVPFIVNENVELAKRIGADVVHIGQADMELARAREILESNAIIGVTAKTIQQAQAAEVGGSDYFGSGEVFGSSIELDAKPIDHGLF